MTKQDKTRPRLPNNTIDQTRCGQRLNDNDWQHHGGFSYTHHSLHSETPKQRNLLAVRARTAGYHPPPQTCCANQANLLIHYLTYLSKQRTTTGQSPQERSPDN